MRRVRVWGRCGKPPAGYPWERRSSGTAGLSWFVAAALSVLWACGDGAGVAPPAGRAAATLALSGVPADVRCVVLYVKGQEATDRYPVDVEPFTAFELTLPTIPVGSVSFRAEAFAADCTAVMDARPDWQSDPQAFVVRAGDAVEVTLTLRRRSSANVSIGFEESPACHPQGAGCSVGSDCCSGLVCDAATSTCGVSTGPAS